MSDKNRTGSLPLVLPLCFGFLLTVIHSGLTGTSCDRFLFFSHISCFEYAGLYCTSSSLVSCLRTLMAALNSWFRCFRLFAREFMLMQAMRPTSASRYSSSAHIPEMHFSLLWHVAVML